MKLQAALDSPPALATTALHAPTRLNVVMRYRRTDLPHLNQAEMDPHMMHWTAWLVQFLSLRVMYM